MNQITGTSVPTRTIYILLTQFPGWNSRAIRLWTRFPYTHASLGLEEDLNTFYSFVCKGFIVESVTRYNKPGRKPFPCVLYALEVPEATYLAATEIIDTFLNNRSQLRYSSFGVVMGLVLRIPFRRKNHYFCSQFVAEGLSRCQALRLKKETTLYLPKDFFRNKDLRMVFRGDLLQMSRRFQAA